VGRADVGGRRRELLAVRGALCLLVGLGLVVTSAGCPQLSSDDFSIVADGGTRDGGAGSGDGGELDGPPTVECDGGMTACGSSCVDTQHDGRNCGACGHDCQGGACQSGACQPVRLASGPTGTTDAGNTILAEAIAVDSGTIYWIALNVGVMSCAVTGCSRPALLAPGTPNGQRVAVDSTNVYWIDMGVLETCPKTGCTGPPMPLLTGTNAVAFDIAAGAAYIATVNTPCDGGTCVFVGRCATTGCSSPPSAVFSLAPAAGSIGSLAHDRANLYATPGVSGSVLECALGGCNGSPTVLASAATTTPADIVADGTNTYWIDGANGDVRECAVTGCNDQPTTLFASGGQGLSGIAVDAMNVYWGNATTGAIERCAIGGCKNQPTDLVIGQNGPRHLTLDTTSVYWTNADDGTVMTIAK
jgi:hypothetical protein